MKTKLFSAFAILLMFADAAMAAPISIPEIDGALSLQAITLLVGVAYLLKRRK